MRTNRRGIATMAAVAALMAAGSLAVVAPASAAAPPRDSERFERSYQQNDYNDRSMRSGPYRTPQTMEREAYRQGFEAGRRAMRKESRYDAEERAYRALLRADDGLGQRSRNSDTYYDTYRAWPGVEAGNYR